MWYNFYDEREIIREENDRMRMAERLIQEDMYYYNGKFIPDNRVFDIYDTKYQNAKDGVFDWSRFLKKEGAKWVFENIGEEYVDEFLEKYDDINRGIPIGGMAETAVFLDMIEQIKGQI